MDLGFLQAEIDRKRRQITEKNILEPSKKYFKRSTLKEKLEEEYWAKHAPKAVVPEAKETQNLSASLGIGSSSTEEERILPRNDVIKRLRERNEPILLYGETDYEAFKRLRHLEILEPEVTRGFRNDFQEAMERVDQTYLDHIIKSQGGTEHKSTNNVEVDDGGVTLDDIQGMAKTLRKSGKANDATTILAFLKFILQTWGIKLNTRSEEEKLSTTGRIASATYTQTLSYIKPLFKKLKNNNVPDDILEHLLDIFEHLMDRNYVKANDAYLQMAIGNAPWPIGVTMVGIHARTGREKIFSKNIAHVLNDETQRKFIQALKRLMTQCQRLFPTDPSRCVEYNA